MTLQTSERIMKLGYRTANDSQYASPCISVVHQIENYRKNLTKFIQHESKVLLGYLDELFHLSVTVQHLIDSNIEETVDVVLKYQEAAAVTSRILLQKWRTIAAEKEKNVTEEKKDQSSPETVSCNNFSPGPRINAEDTPRDLRQNPETYRNSECTHKRRSSAHSRCRKRPSPSKLTDSKGEENRGEKRRRETSDCPVTSTKRRRRTTELDGGDHLKISDHGVKEERTLDAVLHTKNTKTKVYSGNKSCSKRIPSMYELCTNVILKNIRGLEVTGGVSYNILEPILMRISPSELFTLEYHNPYLLEDTDPLWELHCSRRFRNEERREMETWRETYLRCLNGVESKLDGLTVRLRQAKKKAAPVKSLKYVDNVKLPRDLVRKQAKQDADNTSTCNSDLQRRKITEATLPTEVAISATMPTSESSVPKVGKKNKAPLMSRALQMATMRHRRYKR